MANKRSHHTVPKLLNVAFTRQGLVKATFSSLSVPPASVDSGGPRNLLKATFTRQELLKATFSSREG